MFTNNGQNGRRRDFHFFEDFGYGNWFFKRHDESLALVSHPDLHGVRSGVHLKRLMAPRERFELPRHEDSGFRIHRDTGLCDLGCRPSTFTFDISLTSLKRRSLSLSHLHSNQYPLFPCLPSLKASVQQFPEYCRSVNQDPSRNQH